jgi:hypothetical protein
LDEFLCAGRWGGAGDRFDFVGGEGDFDVVGLGFTECGSVLEYVEWVGARGDRFGSVSVSAGGKNTTKLVGDSRGRDACEDGANRAVEVEKQSACLGK